MRVTPGFLATNPRDAFDPANPVSPDHEMVNLLPNFGTGFIPLSSQVHFGPSIENMQWEQKFLFAE